MPSINVDLDFFDHIKTKRLIARLGDCAPLYLIKLWVLAGRFYPETGCFKQCLDTELEKMVGWTGEPSMLLATLTEIECLDKTPDGYKIHEWKLHCGHLALYKKRAKAAASARWSKHATSIPEEEDKNARSYAYTILCYTMQCNNSPLPLLPPKPETLAECFNGIPGVKKISFNGRLPETIRKTALARLAKHPNPHDWNKFFDTVAKSEFLTGRKQSQGRDPFQATFSWVLGPKNFDKIMAGDYTDQPVKKKSFVYT